MSEQDKQFVDAVTRWRSADEKDVRIAALEAECERLQETVNGLDRQNDYLAEEIARLTDELAAPQSVPDGVEVVAWRVSHPEREWKVYGERPDWAEKNWGAGTVFDVQPLMTVAQYQRITAAMAAEVERLRDDLEVMTADRDGCARQRDQLRAELWTGAWTLPPEAPDVSGLVEALKEARAFTLEHDSGRAGYVRGRIDAALAAHKAHHNPTTQED